MKKYVAALVIFFCFIFILYYANFFYWISGLDFNGTTTEQQFPQFFEISKGSRGPAIVLHGMNVLPSAMDEWGHVLAQQGYAVTRVALSGHRVDEGELVRAKASDWQRDMSELAKTVSPHFEMCLGYSLGGLAIVMAELDGTIVCEKKILFAPALRPHVPFGLIKIADALGLLHIKIPSAVPVEYSRYHNAVLEPNVAIFEAIAHNEKQEWQKTNRATLVMMDPDDEMVSWSKTEKLLKEKKLTQWKMISLNNEKSNFRRKFHHLILDSRALGKDEWARVVHLESDFTLAPKILDLPPGSPR